MQRQGLDDPQEIGGAAAGHQHLLAEEHATTRCILNNYATINIIDPLSRIRGVGQATLFGPLDYSLRLWLDPDRLTAFNLTPADVVTAVQSQNVQAALGRIGAAPIAAATSSSSSPSRPRAG